MTTKTKIKGTTQFREVRIDRGLVDEEKRTVELAFSSEQPVERWFGIEILDHNAKSIRLGRLKDAGPLLMDHNSRDHVGVVESVTIDKDKVGRAVVRFGKSDRADEVFQDVLDGIRTKVSVGYIVHEIITDEKKNELPIMRVVDWEPLEISMVSVPADETVGVGRGVDTKNNQISRGHTMDEEEKKRIQEEERQKVRDAEDKRKKEEAREQEIKEERIRIREESRKEEQDRIREISAIGEKLNKRDEAQAAISSGMTIDVFREKVLLDVMNAKPVETTPDIGLSGREVEQFSILRAINSIIEKGDLSQSPFERECSEAVMKKFGKRENDRGFSVPHEVIEQKRDLSVGTATAGGNLVATNLMAASFIDLLRNAMMVIQMGATVLDGLVGDIAIPRQTGGATGYWVAEDGDPTESQQAFDQVAFTPKTVGAFTDMTRKLLMQSSIDVENFVRQDLATVLGLTMDLAAINGSGASNQPTGILNTSGIGAVVGGTNGAVPTWGDMVDLEREVSKDNAAMGSLGYLVNSDTVGKLKQTEKAANTAQFIMNTLNQPGFAEVNGYRAGMSNQIPNNITKGTSGATLSAMIFGNWRDLILAYWGSLDVLVDPYAGGLSGRVRIRVLRDVDINVRHPESFSAHQDMITV